ncbi:acyltransferase family protein [Pseudoneobacillus rhizosphaerae]|uniref:Acyltransferase 3 domain-containing protein n=1 Tax=Pseudoneobacillus rhizosphaerae TaxID=2880968 RepID=A0A9C7G6F1_9BACI|nr:acyltransferase [Pseudoneobacillus rhizosphaerae]CAG9606583.1 hypothetical protein NEOCIP111885_00271 [Pseudoneobacillus rhizosphaerae]
MRRYEELDSLRGLAALSVVFCHFLLIYPALDYLNNINNDFWFFKFTPLHLLWSGHEAVILFFILSGFVLSLPFYSGKSVDYITFLTKRICRIYLPYIIAVVFSLAGCVVLYNGNLTGLSEWINVRWDDQISLKMIIGYVSLIFLPSYSGNEYNPALWSLVHEMRISIIFPIIIFFINRLDWKVSVLTAALLSFLGFVGKQAGLHFLLSDFLFSLQYLFMFVIGSLMAKHKDCLATQYSKLSRPVHGLALIAGILCYTYSWWFFYDIKILHLEVINDWVITLGAAIFIIYSLFSKVTKILLLFKPVHFLGEISYSLYLFHGLVLLSLLHILHDSLSTWIILMCSLFVSIGISTISYYLIEKPSITLGRKIASQLTEKQKVFKKSA